MHNLITFLCQIAIIINVGIFIVGVLNSTISLACLSIINIALLSTRFIIFKGEEK